ncbi:dihydrofolate reductase family protein [Amycolatopsis granulosa]|uniref:dihydrofolate reductase family protein n=1 Tax=Amycolatopsis granulosa TaxID=185684 RepID=UPI0014220531|nr:dihydrofolate reductase family protein [Amycolatopsis granulosa]NIH84817.1 dihydrofolate reductase [Amycolatopsis granulosa]
MSTVYSNLSVSADGFLAGPRQSRENPLGEGGLALHEWHLERAADNRAEADTIVDAGAFVMGRNMFGPVRGEWDEDWRGWWGEEPPYHGPVFVLTHFPREPVVMAGGTTFHFVTDGIESALTQARAAAGDRNVSIAGGASTVNQFLAAGLLDELRLHIAPIVLGEGERLFAGVRGLDLEATSSRTGARAIHVTYRIRR